MGGVAKALSCLRLGKDKDRVARVNEIAGMLEGRLDLDDKMTTTNPCQELEVFLVREFESLSKCSSEDGDTVLEQQVLIQMVFWNVGSKHFDVDLVNGLRRRLF